MSYKNNNSNNNEKSSTTTQQQPQFGRPLIPYFLEGAGESTPDRLLLNEALFLPKEQETLQKELVIPKGESSIRVREFKDGYFEYKELNLKQLNQNAVDMVEKNMNALYRNSQQNEIMINGSKPQMVTKATMTSPNKKRENHFENYKRMVTDYNLQHNTNGISPVSPMDDNSTTTTTTTTTLNNGVDNILSDSNTAATSNTTSDNSKKKKTSSRALIPVQAAATKRQTKPKTQEVTEAAKPTESSDNGIVRQLFANGNASSLPIQTTTPPVYHQPPMHHHYMMPLPPYMQPIMSQPIPSHVQNAIPPQIPPPSSSVTNVVPTTKTTQQPQDQNGKPKLITPDFLLTSLGKPPSGRMIRTQSVKDFPSVSFEKSQQKSSLRHVESETDFLQYQRQEQPYHAIHQQYHYMPPHELPTEQQILLGENVSLYHNNLDTAPALTEEQILQQLSISETKPATPKQQETPKKKQERFAGGSWANSPPPSSLPTPQFSSRLL